LIDPACEKQERCINQKDNEISPEIVNCFMIKIKLTDKEYGHERK
jgi:hypothetical protein